MTYKTFFAVIFMVVSYWMPASVFAQDTIASEIARIVFMDSVVVKASRQDFSVEDFIDMVRKDETFYRAFSNLRVADYFFSTHMTFFDRKNRESATYDARYHQHIKNQCRFQEKLEENIDGNFRRKRKDDTRYYTYDLYDRLFLLHDTTCHLEVNADPVSFEGEGMEGHVAELKKLIFAPGSHSDIPLIGDKTEIFSEKMINRYHFFINSVRYSDTMDAYVFEVRLKPEYERKQNNRTVIKELITYFSKKDFQVLDRCYRLAHYKALYQFDIKMQIELQKVADRYFPARIVFEGFWNVPVKRKETSIFTIKFEKFQ